MRPSVTERAEGRGPDRAFDLACGRLSIAPRAGALLVAALVALGLSGGAATAQAMREAPGAELRWLDKMSGETADVELSRGQSAVWGRLTIQLDSCRYPEDNIAGEAFAHLTIRDSVPDAAVFSGWMVASSPALSALDHARYDVWVLRCLAN